MSTTLINTMENNQENSACVVCFKDFDLYSIGECDHPICFECSTRMRVLCINNECPICRQDLSKVIFTETILPYRQLETNNRSGLYDKKYRICFETLRIQNEFYKLLENPCSKCDIEPFETFESLKDHVSRKHEHYYCDICTENLRIFSFERKCYTRQELGLHRRKGDPDNTSHRGHPICKYCDSRYLDRDELFRHLRREHFYCHFCDADGSNQFYRDYPALREHFKAEHFLCEEGECAREQFTAVFRTDIDLKGHNASHHCRTLGKMASKQARTLEFEFTLAPRNQRSTNQTGETSRNSVRIRNDQQIEFDGENYDDMSSFKQQQYQQSNQHTNQQQFHQNPSRVIDSQNEQEFPSLGGNSNGTTAVTFMRQNMSIRAKTYSGTKSIAKTKENFPALGNQALDPGPSLGRTSSSSSAVGQQYNKNSSSSILKNSTLSSSVASTKQGGMVIHVSNRPTSTPVSNTKRSDSGKSSNDFPALPHSNNLKHFKYLDIEDSPMLPTNPILTTNVVAAKHKSLLMDDFQTVGSRMGAKITLIQKENVETQSPKKSTAPPKLNSSDNFPELSSGSATTTTTISAQWVVPKTKESRKVKVAAAPILTNNINGGSTSSRTNILNGNNKVKTEKITIKNNQQSNSISTINQQTKKEKEKKPNQRIDKKDGEIKLISNKQQQQNNNKNIKDNNSRHIEEMNNNNNSKSNTENLTERKLNEMKIDRLKKQELKANLLGDEFPSLSKNSDAGSTTNPPPGFDNKKKMNPPPGFSVTLNSVARTSSSSNNLTFTNSLGESYNIKPTYKYVPPPNATKRNQVLVTHFQQALQQTEAMEDFRRISQMFRDNQYFTLPYYEHCRAALGDKFDEIFPELLALLPDIAKQQELYLVHSQQLKETTKINKKQLQQMKNHQRLEVCSVCKQVLTSNDLLSHIQSHSLENNFPTLNNKQQQQQKSQLINK